MRAFGERAQRRCVTDPAIALPAQAIKLDCETPEPFAGSDIADRDAARRRRRERDFVRTEGNAVITDAIDRRCDKAVFSGNQSYVCALAVLKGDFSIAVRIGTIARK